MTDVTRLAVEQYDALGRGLTEGDDGTLLWFVDAWAALLQDVSDLVSDTADQVDDVSPVDGGGAMRWSAGQGWSQLFDVDRCPPAWLPILAVFAGVVVPAGMSTVDARGRIRSAPGRRAATVGALRQSVAETLTDTKTVGIVERDGSAYQVTVQTYASETPDVAATEASALRQTPTWLVLSFDTVPGPTWQLVDTTTTWASVDPALTWDGVASLDPGEL